MKSPLRVLSACLFLVIVTPGYGQDNAPYRLKSGDKIRLNVFQEPDLLTEVAITQGGGASFPLIGTVQLSGQTLQEAETAVTTLYNADYLVEPRLSINLLAASAETVTVIGAVAQPGVAVPIPPNTDLDLASAIDWAGGTAPNADESRIELKRGEDIQIYSLAKLRAKGAAQVKLRNGDRINVAASPFAGKAIMMTGEVKRPGPVQFPVSGGLDVEMAIGIAGGFSEMADPNRITVKRGGKLYSASLAGAQRALLPGDIVSVPPSRFLGKSVTVMGQVSNPGQVAFPPDGSLDILTAVTRSGGFARLANKKKVIVTRRNGANQQAYPLDLAAMAEGKARLFYLQPDDTISIPERRF